MIRPGRWDDVQASVRQSAASPERTQFSVSARTPAGPRVTITLSVENNRLERRPEIYGRTLDWLVTELDRKYL